MQSYYAARAPEYDAVYAKPERQGDLRQIERWLPPIFADTTVLEVACGTGYWTQFIAAAACHVLALDAAPETIRIAKERVSPAKVEFLPADAYALPRLEHKCARGFAGFWYSHIPKSRLREFLLGFHAQLEAGARVVFLDNLFVAGSSTPLSETDSEGNTYQERILADGSKHRVLKNFPSENDLRDALRGLCCGFKYRTWQYYWAVEYTVATN